MPQTSPSESRLLTEIGEVPNRLNRVLEVIASPSHQGRYLHWDKLRRLSPPEDLAPHEWWLGLKIRRSGLQKAVPLEDESGRPFVVGLPDPAPELLHHIDQGAGGRLQSEELITNPQTRDRYIINSLIEEAIRSSQLEGAVATRQVAKEMIRSQRAPRDRSEQMILNNFRTMQRIQTLRNEPLTLDRVLELHRLLTERTLPAQAVGRFRTQTDRIRIEDDFGEVFHLPPPAKRLEERLELLCQFANGRTPEIFIHPVVRSIILHFWLAYDHPFVDGNGRCARALFYWSMLRHDYWLCEYLSISHIIRKAPMKYYRAFLYTETDENDLTYFVLYHLDVISKAIADLSEYLKRKTKHLREVDRQLRAYQDLNHRQRALMSHAIRHPDARYSIQSHRSSHNVVYETARTDLLSLANQGLLKPQKVGRTWYYYPATDLEEKLGRPVGGQDSSDT